MSTAAHTLIELKRQFWHRSEAGTLGYLGPQEACSSVEDTRNVCGRLRILNAEFRVINLGVPKVATYIDRGDVYEFGTGVADTVQQKLCELLLQIIRYALCATVLLRQVSTYLLKVNAQLR